MAEKNNVIPAEQTFTKPSLVTADGSIKQFNVRIPSGSLSREFYKMRRRYSAITDEYKEIRAREDKIDAELLELRSVIDGTPPNEDRIKVLTGMRDQILNEKDQSDIDFHKNLHETCALIVDTNGIEIQWDECDLRQVRGAIDFFTVSANASGYAPRT